MSPALAIAVAVAVPLLVALPRLFAGPTLYDRALAAKTVLVRVSLIVAAGAVWVGDRSFLDAAIALALATLVFAAATAKVFRARSFQTGLAPAGEQ